MSEEDQTFTSKGIFREETLYYDLGYRFAQLRGRKPEKMLDLDLTGYLFLISLLLQFVFNIPQFFTLGTLVVFFVYSSAVSTSENKSASTLVLILIFAANVLDQFIGGILITPGLLVAGKLTTLVWIIELIWILLFSTQVIITLQPVTPVFLKGLSVQPETKKARNEYEFLKFRTRGTDFEISELDNSLDLDLLRDSLINLLKTIAAVVGIALLLDVFVWVIVGSFGGGTNIAEQYFTSGLVLILFILIYLSVGMLFPAKTENKVDTAETDK